MDFGQIPEYQLPIIFSKGEGAKLSKR